MPGQRKKFIILIVAFSVVTFGWITIGAGSEEVPYVSIAQLVETGADWKQTRFRLGGNVDEGSIVYSNARRTVEFTLIQEGDRLPVRYEGLTPDMFRDEAEVIVLGQLDDGVFVADNLMTKCASRYEVDISEPAYDMGRKI